ncbi:hypothetical protein LTS18_012970, partial [Coniosporium uncinatum]
MSTMRALVSTGGKTAQVKDVPISTPAEGEILVKVRHVAQNPTDWKAMRAVPPGRIIGCDFSGTIEDPNGSSWRKSQRVAGFVHGTWAEPMRGSFAEYLVTEKDVVYELPEPSKPTKDSFPLFINGGTSSVGKYAIQLAKLSGLFVVASGSKKNHELLKELGADACVDYKDEDWPQQVRKLTHDKLEHAFDCVAKGGSVEKITEAMSPSKGGHTVTLLPISDETKKTSADRNPKVKLESTIVYTVF